MDRDLAIALQLQEEFDRELAKNIGDRDDGGKKGSQRNSPSRPLSIIDESWELTDPNPDIRALFLQYNDQYFWGRLAGVEVKWSPRMTLCAGICCYEGRGGLCSIRLSKPLLSLRPRKDLVETLLHEMIHALLFVTQNNKDHDGHGPEFQKHMNRINKETGTKISIYHNFHDEVAHFQQHWWRCNGPCQQRKPFFGYVKRSMNRAPSPRDFWWPEHQRTCGGTYTKVKEPDGYSKKKKGNSSKTEDKLTETGLEQKKNSLDKKQEKVKGGNMDIRIFGGKGSSLVKGGNGLAAAANRDGELLFKLGNRVTKKPSATLTKSESGLGNVTSQDGELFIKLGTRAQKQPSATVTKSQSGSGEPGGRVVGTPSASVSRSLGDETLPRLPDEHLTLSQLMSEKNKVISPNSKHRSEVSRDGHRTKSEHSNRHLVSPDRSQHIVGGASQSKQPASPTKPFKTTSPTKPFKTTSPTKPFKTTSPTKPFKTTSPTKAGGSQVFPKGGNVLGHSPSGGKGVLAMLRKKWELERRQAAVTIPKGIRKQNCDERSKKRDRTIEAASLSKGQEAEKRERTLKIPSPSKANRKRSSDEFMSTGFDFKKMKPIGDNSDSGAAHNVQLERTSGSKSSGSDSSWWRNVKHEVGNTASGNGANDIGVLGSSKESETKVMKPCPVCQTSVELAFINEHLDRCLAD